jgi:hypothetical protein
MRAYCSAIFVVEAPPLTAQLSFTRTQKLRIVTPPPVHSHFQRETSVSPGAGWRQTNPVGEMVLSTLCCQSSVQTRRREADIGSRANARFLDIGFVPEADAQHPTLSPGKSSLNSCFSTGNSHSICESCGRNLAEGLCIQRRKLVTPKRRARNTPTCFSR